MPKQTICEFYTVHSEQKIVASELQKELYDVAKAAEILSEAAGYHIEFESVSKSWYEDEEEQSFESKPIEPEKIIVKNGKFYGCVLTRESSEWGYNYIVDKNHLTSVTLDNPKVNVYTMDRSTQNGDSYSNTDALLVKNEQ